MLQASIPSYLNIQLKIGPNSGQFLKHFFQQKDFSIGILPDQPHTSINKHNSLLSTRSKGLSLSLKNNQTKQKQNKFCSPIKNQQLLGSYQAIKDNDFLSSLKTTHSIHYLGRSVGKSNEKQNKAILKEQDDKYFQNLNTQSYIFMNNSTQKCILTPQKIKVYPSNDSYHYKIKINTADTIKKYQSSTPSSLQKIGKIKQLKQRTFIRRKQKSVQKKVKQNNSNYLNLLNTKLNCIQINRQKLKNKINLLKKSDLKDHLKVQIKSKRQFLQSYIEKPTINSIILSRKIQDDQPDSPVLRLKKRLKQNSINCIYQKQTIVSHEILQTVKSSQLIIQQSMIVNRNILNNFKPLMHQMNIFVQGVDQPYKLYLAQEIYSNALVTLKQQSVSNFQNFSRELLIYKQIDACCFDIKNILQLHRFSTDTNSNILIKQPFTETLSEYMQNLVMKKLSQQQFNQACSKIINIIKRNIQQLKNNNIILWRKFTLNDFVFVFSNLKIQNLSMFELNYYQKITLYEALNQFQLQMQTFYCRISGGNNQ